MSLSIEHEGEDAGTAGVRSRHCVAAGAGRLCTDVSTQVEVIIMGANPITRFPHLNAVLPAHVDSLFFCAEVRAGNRGGAVIIAVTIISLNMDTRTIHLGAAPTLSIALYNT